MPRSLPSEQRFCASPRRTMKAKIVFAVLLGLVYALMGLGGSFGITAFQFWSGILLSLGMVIVLPLGILAIWKTKLAGRLLLVDSLVVVCTSFFELGFNKEGLGALLIGFPILMSGLLLLKEPQG